jgi:hypothetical protein
MSAATAGAPIVHFVGGIPIAGRRDSVPYPGASNRAPITYHAEAYYYDIARFVSRSMPIAKRWSPWN